MENYENKTVNHFPFDEKKKLSVFPQKYIKKNKMK